MEILSKHFSELHRVFVPRGKALVLNLSNLMYQRIYLSDGVNEEVVQKKIDQILARIPHHPTQQQINKALKICVKLFLCILHTIKMIDCFLSKM